MATRIISVHPASGNGATVVVQACQNGTAPLDLRLVGCEGESPYVTSIQQCNLPKCNRKFKGTDDEWVAIWSYFLLHIQPEREVLGILQGVRMVYMLKNNALELSIRRDVGDIKVTLGEIVLPLDEEFEFNPFDWAQTSAMAHAQTLQQLADLTIRVEQEREAVAKLNAQLQDFIQTKNETETAMLQHFMALLNEKKRKIRDQSRILAGAKVDDDTALSVLAVRAATKPRKPVVSRKSKRKASAPATEPEAKSESDSDTKDMNMDTNMDTNMDMELTPATPDRTDDETDSEVASTPPRREKSSETVQSRAATRKTKDRTEVETKGAPPPRSLPFGRPGTRSRDAAKVAPPVVDSVGGDDDDDETDDEEL